MKKTTINTILMAIIVLMSISICLLIFCITTRPRYITIPESETTIITESVPDNDDTQPPDAIDVSNDIAATEETAVDNTMHGKTSTRVNIRNAASADAKVLDTVDSGTTFDIVEIQENGWTKIIYNGEEGYISSDYVIIITESE